MGKENHRLKVIIIVGAVLVGLSTAFLVYTRHWEAQTEQTVPGPELPPHLKMFADRSAEDGDSNEEAVTSTSPSDTPDSSF